MPKISTQTVQGTTWIDFGDGVEHGVEMNVTTVNDVRLTPLGLWDFGTVTVGPMRPVSRPTQREAALEKTAT